jgi:predicted transposase YdaD
MELLAMQHDTGYKLLFSHPRMVQDLITGFVQPEWLENIDFNTLEPAKASFATDDLRQRHDDAIWRLKFKDSWLYLYLLLEFQSSDDYFMANRIMTYMGLLYQDRRIQLRSAIPAITQPGVNYLQKIVDEAFYSLAFSEDDG